MEFIEFWELIIFIELCKIKKLVMHLNSCSMDLGRDNKFSFYYILHNLSFLIITLENYFRAATNPRVLDSIYRTIDLWSF